MRQIVKETFFEFTVKREGFTAFMYCDVLNLVTSGVGNLIDAGPNNPGPSTAARAALNTVVSAAAMAPAMSLPWKHKGPGWTSKDRNPPTAGAASQAEIAATWALVKNANQALGTEGISQKGGFAYANLTGNGLTLDAEGMQMLFNRTRDSFNATLAKRYPGYEEWPADAQLAIMSMSWALGPAFNFPSFKAAVDRLDFRSAAELSFFKGGGGTMEKRSGRNAENVIMFNNADDVLKAGADVNRLFFPGTVDSSAGVGPGRTIPSDGSGGIKVGMPVGTGAIANVGSVINPRIGTVAQGAAAAVGAGALGWAGFELYKHFTARKKRK